MMKPSAKRRRSRAQILEDKEAALKKDQEIKEKLAAWDDLERALEESEKEREKMKTKYGKYKQLFDDGLVKKTIQGTYEVVQDPNEREHIKQEKITKKRRKTMTPADAEHSNNALDANQNQQDEDIDY